MHRKYKRIGLFDHMGWGNMGDAAVQEAFIINIERRLPDAVLIGFSLYPEDTRKRHNIVSYPITWWYPGWKASRTPSANVPDQTSRLTVLRTQFPTFYALAKRIYDCVRELAHLIRSYNAVRSLDLLIFSGGGQLCELHGDLPYNVLKFCVLAKLSNTPVFIVGVGADLLERPLNKFFAKWSVRLANYTSFRSHESQALVQSLGVKTETHVCPDPAYALDIRDYVTAESSNALTPDQSEALLRNLGIETHTYVCPDSAYGCDPESDPIASPSNALKPKVGLNPMGFCDPRRWPRKDNAAYCHYLDRLTALSKWILAHDYRLEIFTSDIIVDVFAIEDLKKRLLVGASSDERSRLVFRPVLTLKELLLQMSTFEFVVTSKFHGVIFAHLLGKPVIALSYLSKINHLMRAVGHDRYCLDIERCDDKELIETFQLLVAERACLSSLFSKVSATYADALRTHFDNLFGRVVNGVRLEEAGPAGSPVCRVPSNPRFS
jgi:polysaccharide pyruvyl transferase WcaK-like protein